MKRYRSSNRHRYIERYRYHRLKRFTICDNCDDQSEKYNLTLVPSGEITRIKFIWKLFFSTTAPSFFVSTQTTVSSNMKLLFLLKIEMQTESAADGQSRSVDVYPPCIFCRDDHWCIDCAGYRCICCTAHHWCIG